MVRIKDWEKQSASLINASKGLLTSVSLDRLLADARPRRLPARPQDREPLRQRATEEERAGDGGQRLLPARAQHEPGAGRSGGPGDAGRPRGPSAAERVSELAQ